MAPRNNTNCKDSFLEGNEIFSELEARDELKPIGKLDDIDLLDDEIWLLQCPKGMDVKELERQRLKIPGRTNLTDTEAVTVEYVEGVEQQAFAYCDRKGKNAVRLLPVRGTIVLRNRLKLADTITTKHIEACCPPAKRVPMPSVIRARHPLLGHQFEEKLQLDQRISKRLQEADEVSAQMLGDWLATKTAARSKSMSMKNIKQEEDDADETDAVIFVSEEVVKKKKSKRKHSESKCNEDDIVKKKKSDKLHEDLVSKDLQWLQDL